MSVFRVYFFDLATRQELLDHPLSGKSWLGTAGNCHVAGEFVRGTTDAITLCDHSSLRHISGERRVTAEDFDRPVIAKVWAPKSVDWRVLARDGSSLTPEEAAAAEWCEAQSTP